MVHPDLIFDHPYSSFLLFELTDVEMSDFVVDDPSVESSFLADPDFEISDLFDDDDSDFFPFNWFISKPMSCKDFKASTNPAPPVVGGSAMFDFSLPVTHVRPSPSHMPQRSNLAFDPSFLSQPTG